MALKPVEREVVDGKFVKLEVVEGLEDGFEEREGRRFVVEVDSKQL